MKNFNFVVSLWIYFRSIKWPSLDGEKKYICVFEYNLGRFTLLLARRQFFKPFNLFKKKKKKKKKKNL